MRHSSIKDFAKDPDPLLPGLKKLDQWMCWYFRRDIDGKIRKKPYPGPFCETLYEPGVAKYSDSRNWMSYKQARSLSRVNEEVDGIGFVLHENDDFIVLDIDNCIAGKQYTLIPEAEELIHNAASYAEISPSGEGVHVILKGEIRHQGWTQKLDDFRIEIYDRFFITVTMNHILGTPREAIRRQSFLKDLFSKYEIAWPDPKFTSFWPT